MGSIPGSGKSPGGGNGNILAWEIPQTEEPGGLQILPISKQLGTIWQLNNNII